jgi:acyl carrier protein
VPDRPDRGRLREQLRALIDELARPDGEPIDDDAPLISSGRLESIALLNVALWVEEQIDAAVEITSFDLAAEWDSVAQILEFVEKHRPQGRTGPPS